MIELITPYAPYIGAASVVVLLVAVFWKHIKECAALAPILACQGASIFLNGSYGLTGGVALLVAYVSYDFASMKFADHWQNPTLPDEYRKWAKRMTITILVFSVWTAMAIMSIASYKKETADNLAAVDAATVERDSFRALAKQSFAASKRKPNREATYLRESAGFEKQAADKQAEINKLKSETPSERNAIYALIATVLGSTIATIIELLMMLLGGGLVAFCGVALWVFDRRLKYATKTQLSSNDAAPAASATSGTPPETPDPKPRKKRNSKRNYTTQLPKNVTQLPSAPEGVTAELKREAKKAIMVDGVSSAYRPLSKHLNIGNDTVRDLLDACCKGKDKFLERTESGRFRVIKTTITKGKTA